MELTLDKIKEILDNLTPKIIINHTTQFFAVKYGSFYTGKGGLLNIIESLKGLPYTIVYNNTTLNKKQIELLIEGVKTELKE